MSRKHLVAAILVLIAAFTVTPTGQQYVKSGGGAAAAAVHDSVTLDLANADIALTRAAAGTLKIAHAATKQLLWLYGADTGTASTSWRLGFTSPTADGTTAIVSAERGDALGSVGLAIRSQGDGLVSIGNASDIAVVAGTTTATGSKGFSIRSDSCYGFANTVSGPTVDAVTGCLAFAASGTIGAYTTSAKSTPATVQSALAAFPASSVISSATTIAPTTSLFHVSGTTAVVNITKPAQCNLTCMLTIIPDGAFTTTTAGNIGVALTAVVNEGMQLWYDGTKWYPVHGY